MPYECRKCEHYENYTDDYCYTECTVHSGNGKDLFIAKVEDENEAIEFANWIAKQIQQNIITDLYNGYCLRRDNGQRFTTEELYNEWKDI